VSPSEPPKDKPPLHIVRPGDQPPNHRVNKAQRTQLLSVVEQLYLDGNRLGQIVEVLRQAEQKGTLPHVSVSTVRKLLNESIALIERDSQTSLLQNRQRFVNRQYRHMREARKAAIGDPTHGIAPRPAAWSAVRGFEDNIARAQGLYAPDHLKISFAQGENIARMIGDLSDDEVSRIAALQGEVQRKARLYEVAIDTAGEPVPREESPALPEKSQGTNSSAHD